MKKIHLFAIFCYFCFQTKTIAQLHPTTYFSQLTYGAVWSPRVANILVGNINGDSLPDIVLSGEFGYQVGYGAMPLDDLRFDMQPIQFLRLQEWFFLGQLVDFDADGDEDYQTAVHDNTFFLRTYIFENKGGMLSNTFYKPQTPLPDSTQLTFGHFNADTVLDVYHNWSWPHNPVGPFLQDGSTKQYVPLPFDYIYNIETDDFNRDGWMDFLQVRPNAPGFNTQTHRLYINRGDFTFEKFETTGFIASDGFGHFDNDGVADIFDFTGNGLNYKFKTNLLSQDSARFYTLHVSPKLTEQTDFVMDLNRDGLDDLFVFTADSTFFCKNNGDMSFDVHRLGEGSNAAVLRHHPDLPKGTVLGMTHAGTPLLLNFSFSDSTGFSMRQNYNAFSPFVLGNPIYKYPSAALDLDADGFLELCIANEGNMACAEIQSDSTFSEYETHQLLKKPNIRMAAAADWDADGHKDLLISTGADIFWAKRLPDSTLAEPVFITEGLLFEVLDFDQNGSLDLLLGVGPSSTIMMLFENGNPISVQTIQEAYTPQSYMAFDPDADGFPDIGLSNLSGNDPKTEIFMNNGQGFFSKTQDDIPGMLGKSQYYNGQAHIFIARNQDQSGSFGGLAELFRIDPSGTSRQIVVSQWFADTTIGFREAWLLHYNNDSLPDMLFNFSGGGFDQYGAKVVLSDVSGNEQILSFPHSRIAAVEDLSGDGFPEVAWMIGSQIFVERVPTPMVSSIDFTAYIPTSFRVSPNPLPSGSALQIFLENDFLGKLKIELFSLDGQVLQVFEKHKTTQKMVFEIDHLWNSNQIVVRISDEKSTTARLVLKF